MLQAQAMPPMVAAPGPAPKCETCGKLMDWDGQKWVCLTIPRNYLDGLPPLYSTAETMSNPMCPGSSRTVPAHTREME